MIKETPFGLIQLGEDATGITKLSFILEDSPLTTAPDGPFTAQLAAELDHYFLGELTEFKTPLSIQIGTDFQRSVWRALQQVPYGTTCSYQDIAVAIGNPKSMQAIGQANKKNPIAIVIPCHRVIGKNGHMTGYMGATSIGISKKEQLITLEKQRRVEQK